jgi:translation initiation factor IF-3
LRKKQDDAIINDDIRAYEVRCTGENGEAYGIIPTDEAKDLAYKSRLDLVLIAPNAKPPVAKIMNYGKFKYQQEKKKKEARKKQKVIVLKEIKLSVKIADNDIGYKIKHSREFLESGYHVRFRVFLKGREMAHPEAGAEVLRRVWPMVEDIGVMENEPKLEGRYVNMLVVPMKTLPKN